MDETNKKGGDTVYWSKKLPATGMTWKYVWGEVIELLDEVRSLNLRRVMEESCDVYTCTICAITTSTGVNLPILWSYSARGWLRRANWWERWLQEQELPFRIWMLKFGSNYERASKRRIVVWMATKEKFWSGKKFPRPD